METTVVETVQKIHLHIREVQKALGLVSTELDQRALAHDSSKFNEDELRGYWRFSEMPKGLEYGSPEHTEAMAVVMKDNKAFELHTLRNDHHPEHYNDVSKMRFPQIIEMVADWCGAHLAYGNKGGWHKSVRINIEKYNFTPGQKWLINDVSLFLSQKLPQLKDEYETQNAT